MLIKPVHLITAFSLILITFSVLQAQILSSKEIAASDNSNSSESDLGTTNIDTNTDEVKADVEPQTDDIRLRRFEVGGHVTIMFQDDFEPLDVVLIKNGFPDAAFIDRRYETGFGGRFTYNINRNLAIETEINFTPSTKTAQELAEAGIGRTGPFSGGEKTQVLFGAKYGIRKKKFGVFGKVRPGFIHFNAFPHIDNVFKIYLPTGELDDMLILSSEKPATFFNVDVGGVFEYYMTKNTMIRFDIGDTIIRYNKQEPKEVDARSARQNLQMDLGFGFRV